MAVESCVFVSIELLEHIDKNAHAVLSVLLYFSADLFENGRGFFFVHTEDRINVGVVTGAAERILPTKVVNFNKTSCVRVFSKDSAQLMVVKGAAKCFQNLRKFLLVNSTTVVEIEVLKVSLTGLTFIISTVSALTHFLKNNSFQIGKLLALDIGLISGDTPNRVEH